MNPPTSSDGCLRIALIGGGIGGLSLLLGILRHANNQVITPHLYEAASAFSEIGAGVAFGPNAVRSMKAVDPALHQAYFQLAAKAPLVEVNGQQKIAWHHFLMGMDGKSEQCPLKSMDAICTPYNDNRTHNVHRAAFLDSMLSLLPVEKRNQYVSFNKRLVSAKDQGEKGVLLEFADGSTETADAVIGCDGVKSRMRQVMLSPLQPNEEIEPQFTGKYAYRGLVPMTEAVKAVGEQAKLNLMFWGYGGHLVTFPIDQGKTLNVVAFQSERRTKWPHGEQWVIPSSIDEVLEEYNDWGEPVKNLLRLLRKPEKWGLFDHPPARTFYQGSRMCLLGDCAHASTPHQGAGAGMAIEDAAMLSNLIGQIQSPRQDLLETAFSVYDSIRRPRDQKLVKTSREAGLLYDFEQPGIYDDIEKIKEVCVYRYGWIWEHDTDGDIRKAVDMFQERRKRKD